MFYIKFISEKWEFIKDIEVCQRSLNEAYWVILKKK